jgi:hypothetical protein
MTSVNLTITERNVLALVSVHVVLVPVLCLAFLFNLEEKRTMLSEGCVVHVHVQHTQYSTLQRADNSKVQCSTCSIHLSSKVHHTPCSTYSSVQHTYCRDTV